MSITQDARLQPEPAAAVPLNGLAGADFGNPAAWAVALLLVIMPLIANGFFLIEIFGTTMILGVVALSLMFLAG
jgi:branched-chain amino acid transport system permease protein